MSAFACSSSTISAFAVMFALSSLPGLSIETRTSKFVTLSFSKPIGEICVTRPLNVLSLNVSTRILACWPRRTWPMSASSTLPRTRAGSLCPTGIRGDGARGSGDVLLELGLSGLERGACRLQSCLGAAKRGGQEFPIQFDQDVARVDRAVDVHVEPLDDPVGFRLDVDLRDRLHLAGGDHGPEHRAAL